MDWSLIIASGPSLRRSDIEALREFGFARTLVVNCAVLYEPKADILYAADSGWWRFYGPQITWFKGKRVARTHKAPGIEKWRGKGWARTGGNSGHMCLQYEIDHEATHIALLGFDQQKTGGESHRHGDHPKEVNGARTQLGNANNVRSWPQAMARTAVEIERRGVEVLNLSRETALTCFKRVSVEDFLNGRI